MTKKLVVLGLDGVPYTLLNEAFAEGRLPHLKRISDGGTLLQMRSVIPTISSVAWASFATGHNPGNHGVYGFVERDNQLRRYIPTNRDVASPAMWERLNEHGLRAISINVPLTYPPRNINGIIIGGFLGPSIDKIASPQSISQLLHEKNYIIDANPRLAAQDLDGFLNEIFKAFRARADVGLHLMKTERWDLFVCHIMETDRLQHFYWDGYEDANSKYHESFWQLYDEIDQFVGVVESELPPDTELMLLSDHGFCGIESEPDVNVFLQQHGFLKFKEGAADLPDLDPSSVAYSLPPGRIYLNLNGREPDGSVTESQVESVLREISEALKSWVEPESNRPIVQDVFKRDEIYHGAGISKAPDLVAHPHRGFDSKAGISSSELFTKGIRNGMHTFKDAFFLVHNHKLDVSGNVSILDTAPTGFDLMGVPQEPAFDGRSLVKHTGVES